MCIYFVPETVHLICLPEIYSSLVNHSRPSPTTRNTRSLSLHSSRQAPVDWGPGGCTVCPQASQVLPSCWNVAHVQSGQLSERALGGACHQWPHAQCLKCQFYFILCSAAIYLHVYMEISFIKKIIMNSLIVKNNGDAVLKMASWVVTRFI